MHCSKHVYLTKESTCAKCSAPREPSLEEIPKDEIRKSAHSVAIGSTIIPRSPFLESSSRKSDRKRSSKSMTQKKDSSYDVIRRFSFV
ncbi:Protein of unknown function [Gryllus bimaculatus]|nr:Protein of unknown function [Gryllus bimaculatus]